MNIKATRLILLLVKKILSTQDPKERNSPKTKDTFRHQIFQVA